MNVGRRENYPNTNKTNFEENEGRYEEIEGKGEGRARGRRRECVGEETSK